LEAQDVTLAALGWADWLALAALGVSLVSLCVSIYFAYRNEQRARRSERRDEERVERERHEASSPSKLRCLKLCLRPGHSASAYCLISCSSNPVTQSFSQTSTPEVGASDR
jgi:hypothetical protein